MATEEQTQYDYYGELDFSVFRAIGQRLTISNRTVSKLGFWLMKEGTGLIGGVYFEINRVSDDSLIVSKYWGVLGDASGAARYEEVTFDTPVLINEEVRIFVRVTGGTADNHLGVWGQSSDVKADEVYCRYRVFTSAWEVITGYDCAYIYTYEAAPLGRYFKVKGTYLHYFDNTWAERRFEGTLTGNARTAGSIGTKGTKFVYGDNNGDERDIEGTLTGNTVTAGKIGVKGTQFRYGGNDTDERYIEGSLV